jgi:NAD(P)-dependent dehydrogenase (short-subunit alcohol dehydrogenase family)
MSLVLITGATGFIGSQVALRTLEAGFNVRLVVRREDQADKLRRIFEEHQDKITFVTSAAFRELYLVYVRGAPPFWEIPQLLVLIYSSYSVLNHPPLKASVSALMK